MMGSRTRLREEFFTIDPVTLALLERHSSFFGNSVFLHLIPEDPFADP